MIIWADLSDRIGQFIDFDFSRSQDGVLEGVIVDWNKQKIKSSFCLPLCLRLSFTSCFGLLRSVRVRIFGEIQKKPPGSKKLPNHREVQVHPWNLPCHNHGIATFLDSGSPSSEISYHPMALRNSQWPSWACGKSMNPSGGENPGEFRLTFWWSFRL